MRFKRGGSLASHEPINGRLDKLKFDYALTELTDKRTTTYQGRETRLIMSRIRLTIIKPVSGNSPTKALAALCLFSLQELIPRSIWDEI